jgi:hypothetical protein
VSKNSVPKSFHRVEQTIQILWNNAAAYLKEPPSFNPRAGFALCPTDARLFTHRQRTSLLHFQTKAAPPYKHNKITSYRTSTHSTQQQHHAMSPPARPTGTWPSDGEIYQGTLESIARDIGKPIYEVETVLSIGLQMGKAGLTKKFDVWIYNLNSTFIPDILDKYDEVYGRSATAPRGARWDAHQQRFGYS